MTPDCKKRWRQCILRGFGAVFFGWAVICAFVVLISSYGVSDHIHVKKTTAIQTVKFPENEQMLDEMTAQLAREGQALSKMEPAAGARVEPPAGAAGKTK